jgi:2-oxoisovalerate dehydrogenase E1 component beta subunit
MATMNIIQAVNSAMDLAMERDNSVLILGEDVARFGGVFRATAGLFEKFGAERVIDTPLSEAGIIGTSIGMALYGLRPVPEIQFVDFIFPAYDHIVSELAKYRYRSGGHFSVPVVIRTPFGGGIRGGLYHSQSPESLFAHIAGLKVVIPSNPYDAKGLLLSAIEDDDPIIFMEPKRVYRAARGEVPEDYFTVPIGLAAVPREGTDVTVVCYGAMVHTALEAAEVAESRNVSLEVVDLRSLVPLDIDTVIASAKKTGRIVIAHEAPRTCGFGAELVAQIQERAFLHLEAPIERVTGLDTPFPHTLEHEYLPDAERIFEAALATLQF